MKTQLNNSISIHTLQIHNIRVCVNQGIITAEQAYPLAVEAIIRNAGKEMQRLEV